MMAQFVTKGCRDCQWMMRRVYVYQWTLKHTLGARDIEAPKCEPLFPFIRRGFEVKPHLRRHLGKALDRHHPNRLPVELRKKFLEGSDQSLHGVVVHVAPQTP